MKKYKNKLIFTGVLISVFILGYLTSSLFNDKSTNINNETGVLISTYSELPFAIDSIEKLSVAYHDTANMEMLHYVINYNQQDISEFPDYYVTNFGDTIVYNKENFYYYVAMYTVAENLLATRKHIINGLLLNMVLEEENQIRQKVQK